MGVHSGGIYYGHGVSGTMVQVPPGGTWDGDNQDYACPAGIWLNDTWPDIVVQNVGDPTVADTQPGSGFITPFTGTFQQIGNYGPDSIPPYPPGIVTPWESAGWSGTTPIGDPYMVKFDPSSLAQVDSHGNVLSGNILVAQYIACGNIKDGSASMQIGSIDPSGWVTLVETRSSVTATANGFTLSLVSPSVLGATGVKNRQTCYGPGLPTSGVEVNGGTHDPTGATPDTIHLAARVPTQSTPATYYFGVTVASPTDSTGAVTGPALDPAIGFQVSWVDKHTGQEYDVQPALLLDETDGVSLQAVGTGGFGDGRYNNRLVGNAGFRLFGAQDTTMDNCFTGSAAGDGMSIYYKNPQGPYCYGLTLNGFDVYLQGRQGLTIGGLQAYKEGFEGQLIWSVLTDVTVHPGPIGGLGDLDFESDLGGIGSGHVRLVNFKGPSGIQNIAPNTGPIEINNPDLGEAPLGANVVVQFAASLAGEKMTLNDGKLLERNNEGGQPPSSLYVAGMIDPVVGSPTHGQYVGGQLVVNNTKITRSKPSTATAPAWIVKNGGSTPYENLIICGVDLNPAVAGPVGGLSGVGGSASINAPGCGAPPVLTAPVITSANHATFNEGSPKTFSVKATGNPDPTFAVSSGSLPAGLTLSAGGVLQGAVTDPPGTYTFQIAATNSQGSATQNFTLTVDATGTAPNFTSATSTVFTTGVDGFFDLTADGTPAPSITLDDPGDLPIGVVYEPGASVLEGTPAPGQAGDYVLTFTADNGVDPDDTQVFTLGVRDPILTDLIFLDYDFPSDTWDNPVDTWDGEAFVPTPPVVPMNDLWQTLDDNVNPTLSRFLPTLAASSPPLPQIATSELTAMSTQQQVMVRVDVYSNEGDYITTLPSVVGGSVTVDATATTRRTCQLTIQSLGVDGDMAKWGYSLVPETVGDLLHPATGNELYIYRGFAYPDGTHDLAALGVFRMTKPAVQDTGDGVTITVNGFDRSGYISRIKWTSVYSIQANTDLGTALKNLLTDRWSGLNPLTFSFVPTNPIPPGYPGAGNHLNIPTTTYGTDLANSNDPWADAVGLALAAGMDLFFNPNGVCVMRPLSTVGQAVSFSTLYVVGENCTMVEAGRTLDETATYNGVLLIGTGTSGPPVHSRSEIGGKFYPGVWDVNQSNPTYYDPSNPDASSWGPVPFIHETKAIPGFQSCPGLCMTTKGSNTLEFVTGPDGTGGIPNNIPHIVNGDGTWSVIGAPPITGHGIPQGATIVGLVPAFNAINISANAALTSSVPISFTAGGAADTPTQAQVKINSAAIALLPTVMSVMDETSFTCVPNPAMQEFEVINVLRGRAGISANANANQGDINTPTPYVVQAMDIPLDPTAAMTVTCKPQAQSIL